MDSYYGFDGSYQPSCNSGEDDQDSEGHHLSDTAEGGDGSHPLPPEQTRSPPKKRPPSPSRKRQRQQHPVRAPAVIELAEEIC